AAARAGVHLVADFRPTGRNRMMEVAYRFAGFTTDSCDCVDLPAAPDVQLLHLEPAPQSPPDTMRIRVPVPFSTAPDTEWVRADG
ncbi:hypothetical protein ABZS39_15970, partial [Micromonospora luteifusca]